MSDMELLKAMACFLANQQAAVGGGGGGGGGGAGPQHLSDERLQWVSETNCHASRSCEAEH